MLNFKAFFTFDIDRSGSITRDEIECIFDRIGAPNIDAESK